MASLAQLFAQLVRGVANFIEGELLTDSPADNGLWPVPPLSAEKKMEMHWPEEPRKYIHHEWPPFYGHRYPLGGGT
jgi:hypothetical protein